MNQLRFQIGVPRAGSAARSSEEEERPFSRSSMAGSAARDAEERRRAETPFERAPNRIALRATGGVTANASPAMDLSARKLPEISQGSSQAGTVPSSCAGPGGAGATAAGVGGDGNNRVEAVPGEGATRSVVSRISSLTRSLFSRDLDG